MAFEKKTVAEMQAALAAGMARAGVTNFNPGGVANTLAEDIGTLMGEGYDFGDDCLLDGMAATSRKPFIDSKALERGIPKRLEAKKLTGVVVFGRNSVAPQDYPVTEGDIVSTVKDLAGNRYRFLATETKALPTGDTEVEVKVEAELVGAAYNVAAGAISVMARPIAGFDWVNNETDWITIEGADEETDAKLQERYFLAWDALVRGATTATYALWALSADVAVVVAWIDSNFPRGEGTIDVYILGPAGTPTPALLETVQIAIDGKRPAGEDVLAVAPKSKTVNITIKIYRYANTDAAAIEATVRAALAAYFSPLGSVLFDWIRPLKVGTKVVFTHLIEIATRPEGVYDATVTVQVGDDEAYSGDVPVSADELPSLGAVTITHEEVVV